MEERTGIRDHACRLENRNAASLTGVREVVSFDENQVVMDTDMGLLTIKGKTSMSAGLPWKRENWRWKGRWTVWPILPTKHTGKPGSPSWPGSLADGGGVPGGTAAAAWNRRGINSDGGVRHPALSADADPPWESGGRS